MIDTQYSRRLDTLGRLVIPKRLREQYGLVEGIEHTFYEHEFEGDKYLCIKLPKPGEEELQRAKDILQKAGYQVSQN